VTREDRLEALEFLEKEEAKLIEYREYFHHKGDKHTPVLDKKIRVRRAAIMALTEPVPSVVPSARVGHTCVVLGPCEGDCWGGAKK